MIIVPIAGDNIELDSGLPGKVLSYTNYRSDGPAVIVEGGDVVLFKNITKIGDQKVKILKNADGYNVFEVDGHLSRKFQLPQPGDAVFCTIDDVKSKYIIERVRIHVKDKLSSGMILDAIEQDENTKIELHLDDIDDVEHSIFSRKKFLEYYADYREKGKA